jgi:hypothetical protein
VILEAVDGREFGGNPGPGGARDVGAAVERGATNPDAEKTSVTVMVAKFTK